MVRFPRFRIHVPKSCDLPELGRHTWMIWYCLFMIPVRVALENFMPYKGITTPLELEGLQLVCLSGANGHGKSALLDAITWALWGKSRARSDDDLIHAGQDETQVTLDFIAGGDRYRVIRRHRKPRGRARSGQSSVDLQISTESDFRVISGNTMRETNKILVDLLQMEYDTFINSAFLIQGRADLFTMATPTERKQVLSDILGLSTYDVLEERARNRVRDAENHLRVSDLALSDMEKDLEKRVQLQTDNDEQQIKLRDLEDKHSKATDKLTALQERRTRLDLVEEQIAETVNRNTAIDVMTETASTELNNAQGKLDRYSAILSKSDEVLVGYHQLQETRLQLQELSKKATLFVDLNSKRTDLQNAINKEGNALEVESNHLQSQIDELRQEADRKNSIEKDIDAFSESLLKIASEEENLDQKRQEFQAVETNINVLLEKNASLRSQMEDLRQKVDLLEEGVTTCPICGMELDEQEFAQVRNHYEVEGQEMANKFRENQRVVQESNKSNEKLKSQLSEIELRLRQERTAYENNLALSRERLKNALAASVGIDGLLVQKESLDSKIAHQSFASNLRNDLQTLLTEIEGNDYQQDEHKIWQDRIKELERFEARFREVNEAENAHVREKEILDSTKERLNQLEKNKRENSERLVDLKEQVKGREEFLTEFELAKNAFDENKAELDNVTKDLTRIGLELERLSRIVEEQREKTAQRKEFAHQRDTYAEVAKAFGKQGVQALLIETALPEIEEEANKLLSTMTEGKMSVQLESQRETRQGRIQETLSVSIADEMGTRPYEMYSGGEAFRINLALRIGLSRILTRRSGAPLPVLFIDEGFGSQDLLGRDRIVDAISSIQNEFQLIIVITHIDELKELFPNRIEVKKLEEGSEFTVHL